MLHPQWGFDGQSTEQDEFQLLQTFRIEQVECNRFFINNCELTKMKHLYQKSTILVNRKSIVLQPALKKEIIEILSYPCNSTGLEAWDYHLTR